MWKKLCAMVLSVLMVFATPTSTVITAFAAETDTGGTAAAGSTEAGSDMESVTSESSTETESDMESAASVTSTEAGNAESEKAEGKLGTCKWTIGADGVLTISAGEATLDINGSETDGTVTAIPWDDNLDDITAVKVDGSVKLSGNMQYLFSDLSACKSIDLTGLTISTDATGVKKMFDGTGCMDGKTYEDAGVVVEEKDEVESNILDEMTVVQANEDTLQTDISQANMTVAQAGEDTSRADSSQINMTFPHRTPVLRLASGANVYYFHINTEGGTGGLDINGNMYNWPVHYGTVYFYSDYAPTRTGYTFQGYYTGRNGTGTRVYIPSPYVPGEIYGDTAGGWWRKPRSGEAAHYGNDPKPCVYLNHDEADGATVQLYAQWIPNTTTVTLDMQGGIQTHSEDCIVAADGSTETFTTTYDSYAYCGRYAPTRTGYSFQGYYTKPNGQGTKVYEVNVNVGAVCDGTYWISKNGYPVWQYTGSAVTFYAYWTPNVYTVVFNANGVSGTMANESMTYDTAKTLTANNFTRKGYTFTGWNTKADGSGTSYADKASVKNLAESGTVTLYAQWTANTYTVTIPTAITYSNMPTGNVNVTNTYDVSVDCKTGSFGDTIEVASTPSPMVSKSGKGSSLAVSSGSSKIPLSFTAAGTKQDQITITGIANTADVWTGALQYTVTKK